MTKTKVGAADHNHDRPRCRVCGKPLHAFHSLALGGIGPKCARAMPPAERRRLVSAAWHAARAVPVQSYLDAVDDQGDLDLNEAA